MHNIFMNMYRAALNIHVMFLIYIICTFIRLSAANSLCKPLDVSSLIVPQISSLLTGLPLPNARNTVSGDQVRWWNLLHRLDAMEAENDPEHNFISIMALGGSVVIGTNCIHGTIRGPLCAYPKRFADWLQTQYPHVSIRQQNQGKSGSPTDGVLSELPILLSMNQLPDIVTVDFSVNDAVQMDKGSCWKTEEGCKMQGVNPSVLSATEHFLEELLVKLPVTSVVIMVDAEPYDFSIQSHNSHLQAASNYNISVIDYHHLVRHDIHSLTDSDEELDMRSKYWDATDFRHPEWPIHQLIAYVIAYSWELERSRACQFISDRKMIGDVDPIHTALHSWIPYHQGHMPHHISKDEYWNQYQTCSQPLSFYSSRSQFNASDFYHGNRGGSGVRVTKGNWTLYEDRAGKPGWISTGPKGSRIEFDVKFGSNPRLIFGFLRSYEGLGDAVATMSTDKAFSLELMGIDLSNLASQTFMKTQRFKTRSNFSAVVSVTLSCNCKFKLEYVVSC